MTSFTAALDEFLAASPWLGAVDAPAVASLRVMSELLDAGQVTPALLAQHGLVYRSLLKRQPAEDDPEDEFEKLLAEGQQ